MRLPIEDELDEIAGEYLYIIAPAVLPGCPPPGAGLSILSGVDDTPLAADNGEEIGKAEQQRSTGLRVVPISEGRYPVGMQGGLR